MSKRSKAKGSRYEREFISKVCEPYGIDAERVPLSGAMKGYPDDVLVADTWRVECKFRAHGEKFAKLHEWIADAPVLWLPQSKLAIVQAPVYAALVLHALGREVEVPSLKGPTKDVTPRKVVLGWLGDADAIALRRQRHPWLVGLRLSDSILKL